MTPNVTPIGRSFKGAFSYYLHDKGTDEQGRRLDTSERVEWAETRNLATDDPYTAKRIMIATANQADELKRAAGVKNTGQKARKGAVYSYSLSWESEQEAVGLTRADMVAAANDTLKLLKADHLQAVIIAHNDTPHPHVHVIVNRVNPSNGKMDGNFTLDWDRLDAWAGKYERERGIIVTPRRQAKEQGRQQHPDLDQRRAYMKAKRAEQKQKRQQAVNSPRIVQEGPDRSARRQSPAAALKARGDAQKAAHRDQWARMSAKAKTRRSAIYEAADRRIKDRLRIEREQHRPAWAELHRQQKAERRAHEARERYLTGVVFNALAAVRSRQIRGDGSDRGFLSLAFACLASRDARRAEFERGQLAAREQLAATTKTHNAAAIAAIKDERSKALTAEAARVATCAERLKVKQAGSNRKIREEWKAIYQEREQAAGGRQERESRQPREYRPRDRQRAKDARRETRAAWFEERTRRADVSRRYAEARQAERPAPQEPDPMKDRFDKARGEQRPDARPIPNRTVSLSRPSPAPSPIGDVPAPKREAASVPAIDKAKEWGKTQPAPQAVPPMRRDWNQSASPTQAPVKTPAQSPAPQARPTPRKDWSQLAGPTPQRTPAPEPERTQTAVPVPRPEPASPSRDESRQMASRKDWGAMSDPTRDRPREIKPLPERSTDRDRDR